MAIQPDGAGRKRAPATNAKKARREGEAGVTVIEPPQQTDYEQFTTYARQQGCHRVGALGQLFVPGYTLDVEVWEYRHRDGSTAGRFFLIVNGRTGKIGVYGLVGKDGDPLVRDIEWLHRTVNP